MLVCINSFTKSHWKKSNDSTDGIPKKMDAMMFVYDLRSIFSLPEKSDKQINSKMPSPLFYQFEWHFALLTNARMRNSATIKRLFNQLMITLHLHSIGATIAKSV